MYKVKLLPTARRDLRNTINYITNVLKSPIAAMNLRNSFKEKFDLLKSSPLIYAEYQFTEIVDFEKPYRMCPVKNFAIFFVVEGNVVEVHRVLYARMNFNQQFE